MSKRRKPAAEASFGPPGATRPAKHSTTYAWFAGAVFLAALIAYLPAANGPFLFDDRNLVPFLESPPEWSFLAARLARAVTNLSMVFEAKISGLNPKSFHLTNILIHLLNGLLVWRILDHLLRRFGEDRPGNRMAALAGAGLYLLHPLQTEAVAYISSRSEVLCAFFAYAALQVFLDTNPAGETSWTRSLAATLLLALSALSKEPGVAMAGVFVALDLFSESPLTLKPLLRRWRLYVPMLAAASFVGFRLYALLSREGTAGATAKHKPIDYLLTQFTVFWNYVRLILFPVGQNLDHDYPVVRAPGTIFTWAGFVAIAAALVLLWKWRARYPLAFLGAVFLLILLAPTSSVVPIDDAMAERRLYLGFPGVAMIAAEFLRRIRPSARAAAAIAAVLAVLGGLTWRRAELYTSAVAMWQDSVSVNPRNSRAWFHLAFAFYEQGRCAEASRAYERAAMAGGPDYTLLVDWALALQCAGRLDEALAKLGEAKRLQRHSHAWAVEGRILAQKGDLGGALESLNEAIRMNPYDSNAMVYRGNVHMLRNDPAAALADYELALRLAPGDPAAAKGRQAALAALARSR